MYSNPTISHRSVTIDITIVGATCPAQPEVPRVGCICVSIYDGQQRIQQCFSSKDEHTLLNSFWAVIRANDMFISYHCLEADLSFVRERTWTVGLRSSLCTGLQRFYSHELINIMELWPTLVPHPTAALQRVLRVLGERRRVAKSKRTAELWAAGDVVSIAAAGITEIRVVDDAYQLLTKSRSQSSE